MALKDEVINAFLNTTTSIKPFVKTSIPTGNSTTNTEHTPTTKKMYSHYKVFDSPSEIEQTASLVNKKTTKSYSHSDTQFSHTSGLTRSIILFLYEKCRMGHDRTTLQLLIDDIAQSCNTTKLSIRKTIQRLEKKQIVSRVAFKSGRNGWTRYGLSESIYIEVLQNSIKEKQSRL